MKNIKKIYSPPDPHLLQAQPALDLLNANVAGRSGTGSYPAPSPSPTIRPYNLARRLRTIISEEQVLETRMKELKSFLVEQKYPENIINMGIDRAMNLDRTILRQVSQKRRNLLLLMCQHIILEILRYLMS